ncbi:MAG: LysR family transcriptional regulator [Paenirhodobacter sp.]|uniref:LysR family transcriptional regulator n=1 Tax=Paenirhodobacter sp. TaxID=1965326 RepID=UPI003D0AB5D8
MTLDQLRIFLAVAAEGHVTRAARALNLTQSAVSAAVSALETRHGVKLFDRVGRGIVLTEAGRAFIPAAQAVLNAAGAAQSVLDDLVQETRGRLRIHASQTVASYWLPPYLARLKAAHPGVELVLTQENTAQVAAAVAEGAADLGFVEGEVTQQDLVRRVVARDELVLVMPRGEMRAERLALTAADYRALRWILREPGSGTRAKTEEHFATMGLALTDLEVALEFPSNEAVLAAVAAGGGVAMLSERAAQAGGARVVLRPVSWVAKPERPFAMLSHPQRHRSRAAAALIALIEG